MIVKSSQRFAKALVATFCYTLHCTALLSGVMYAGGVAMALQGSPTHRYFLGGQKTKLGNCFVLEVPALGKHDVERSRRLRSHGLRSLRLKRALEARRHHGRHARGQAGNPAGEPGGISLPTGWHCCSVRGCRL